MQRMRLDRLATVHFCWPVSRFVFRWRQARTSIPILMYHAVREGISDNRPYYDINVAPAVFANQMRQLRDLGYRSITINQALEAMERGTTCGKLVVLTFDDGYRDFYENAFPILDEFGFKATVYLMPGYMGDGASRFMGKNCLSWHEVCELQVQGIHFGSHTVNHPQLKLMPLETVEQELLRSKKIIEDHVGVPVTSFSYPFSFPEADRGFARQLKDILLECGYENGVTTILGMASARDNRFLLPRLPMNNGDDPQFFRAKIEGGYNWLHSAQYVSKLIGRFKLSRGADESAAPAGS